MGSASKYDKVAYGKPSIVLRHLRISAIPVMHCSGCQQLLRGQRSSVEFRLDGMQTLLLRPMGQKPWHEAQRHEQSQSPRSLHMYQGLKARHSLLAAACCRALCAGLDRHSSFMQHASICIRNRKVPTGTQTLACVSWAQAWLT